jgi:acetyl/propionyl-CoA carboxylase alpha subunit
VGPSGRVAGEARIVSRPLSLRHGGTSIDAAFTLRGTSAVLERDGRRVEATVTRDGSWVEIRSKERVARCAVARGNRGVWVALEGTTYFLEIAEREAGARGAAVAADEIRAPMTGRVVAVAAVPGTVAREGDLLLTIEAMKMEFRLTAPEDGAVLEVACAPGDRVELGQLLVRLKPAAAEGGAA